MTVLGLAVLVAVSMRAGAPWWVTALLALPTLLYAPGLGWARWLLLHRSRAEALPAGDPRRSPADRPPVTGLQLAIDATWISLGWTWIAVGLVRESGLRGEPQAWALLALAVAFGLVGSVLGRHGRAAPSPRRELLGGLAVVVAVLFAAAWRMDDARRPLDAYWWLDGADDEGHEILPLRPGEGWAEATPIGWEEANTWRLDSPQPGAAFEGELVAEDDLDGRVVLAVRGPIGSTLTVAGQTVEIQASPQEEGEDAPVRRYLDRGVAALATDLSLARGEALPVTLTGDQLYVFPGTESIWSAHAEGDLRYTHYWQIVNQVENLDWAREVLDDRWLTLNQPPGWTPVLAVTVLFADGDLPGANLLFLAVLVLVGGSAVRLASLVGRGAPAVAWVVPAAMVLVHALLMFEPASTMFPDSLYAAAVLSVACALAGRRWAWFAVLGIAAGTLRYPGVALATLLALAWWSTGNGRPWRGLIGLWGLVFLGGMAAAGLLLTGKLDDLLFILYFETFPEHWHGDYAPTSLLPRIPSFYWIWLRYTGGGLLVALPFVFGRGTPARRGLRFVLGAALAYSTLLATVDHHPTHYFLPLVALTGVAVVAASASARPVWLRHALPVVVLVGVWTTLRIGQVF
ncbi:MAG: hypothetical protein H6742_16065 [Alphaproteobacteria bacterium]|nr:hypothetical protein [Alphaproteobacteria bacterium]